MDPALSTNVVYPDEEDVRFLVTLFEDRNNLV
jgi:hypothetical protein